MQDPNSKRMATLFAMYDRDTTSDDDIIYFAMESLRCCHDCISKLISNGRFLEAFRQFQHCEAILKETNTDRKVVTLLPSDSYDGRTFHELERRTALLQSRFELARTAGVQREFVGPPLVPRHGGGGVVVREARRVSPHPSLHDNKSGATTPLLGSTPGGPLAITTSAVSAAGVSPRRQLSPGVSHSPSTRSDSPERSAAASPQQAPCQPQLPPIIKVDMLAPKAPITTGLGARSRVRHHGSSTGDTDGRSSSPSNWRTRSAQHIARSHDVIRNAQQAIADMRRRSTIAEHRRDEAVGNALVAVHASTARAQLIDKPPSPRSHTTAGEAAGGSQEGSPSPPTPPKRKPPVVTEHDDTPPRRRSSAAQQQAMELAKAEQELQRRLDTNAQKIAISYPGSSLMDSPHRRQSSVPRESGSPSARASIFANIVYRRRSTAIRDKSKVKVSASRPSYHLSDVDHPLFHEFLGDESMRTASSDSPVDLVSQKSLSDEAAAAIAPFAGEFQYVPRVPDLTPATLAAKLDKRFSRLKSCAHERHRASDALATRLHDRAAELIATGRLHTPMPPIWTTLDELEKFLSPETALLIKQKRSGSFFFPSLMDADPSSGLSLWSSLSALKTNANWTALSAKELMSNLELCIATLRIQCWWRQMLGVMERRRRAQAVQEFVTEHHRRTEALSVVVRCFRQNVAIRKVRGVKQRVYHVNEQRVELELTRQGNRDDSSPLDRDDRTSAIEEAAGGLLVARFRQRKRKNRSRSRSEAPSSRYLSSWSEGSRAPDAGEQVLQRAYCNPFPTYSHQRALLGIVQKKVAARTIVRAYQQYVFRCFEDMQQTADRCLHHILTREYEIDEESPVDDQFGAPFASPFGGGSDLLQKYSGDIIQAIDDKLHGLGGERCDFVLMKHVKLSALRAEEEARAKAEEDVRQAALARERRAVEQELLEQQRRQELVLRIQRVGRGYRRRRRLTASYSNLQDRHSRHATRGVRVDQFSMSLSATPKLASPSHAESPSSEGAKANSEVLHLIYQRNPHLAPERQEELTRLRSSAMVLLQAAMRGRRSSWLVFHLKMHNHARVIQRAWRRVLSVMLQERSERAGVRREFVLETVLDNFF